MTNFEEIKRMSKEELAEFLSNVIQESKRCIKDKNLICHYCYLGDICERELKWLDEEEW